MKRVKCNRCGTPNRLNPCATCGAMVFASRARARTETPKDVGEYAFAFFIAATIMIWVGLISAHGCDPTPVPVEARR